MSAVPDHRSGGRRRAGLGPGLAAGPLPGVVVGTLLGAVAWALSGAVGQALPAASPAPASAASPGQAGNCLSPPPSAPPQQKGRQGSRGRLWLAVEDGASGRKLFQVPVSAGDPVVLAYTHSSDRTPVVTLLTVLGPSQGLRVDEERYAWYGAGLEFHPAVPASRQPGWVVVRPATVVSRLVLRVAETVRQELAVGETCLVLADLAEPGSRLVVSVREAGS